MHTFFLSYCWRCTTVHNGAQPCTVKRRKSPWPQMCSKWSLLHHKMKQIRFKIEPKSAQNGYFCTTKWPFWGQFWIVFVSFCDAIVTILSTFGPVGRGLSAPTGYSPTGYRPTGYRPTGYRPTGYRPTGYRPTGYRRNQAYRVQAYRVKAYRVRRCLQGVFFLFLCTCFSFPWRFSWDVGYWMIVQGRFFTFRMAIFWFFVV